MAESVQTPASENPQEPERQTLAWIDQAVSDGDSLLRNEPAYDTLLKDGDFLIANRTFILYEIYKKSHSETLLAGPYYEVTRADESQITQQKIGAALYWTPADSLWHLNSPKLVAVAGYHFQDPNRQGSLFLLIVVGFEYNL